MSYFDVGNTELISRQGYSGAMGLGLSWSDVTGAAKGALNFYGQGMKSQGQAAAAMEIAKAQAAANAAKARSTASGMGKYVVPIAIGGVALVGVLLLSRRR